MKKETIFSLIAAMAIIFITSIFSWYELRPRNIKADCSKLAFSKSKELIWDSFDEKVDAYDFIYKKCLRDNGL